MKLRVALPLAAAAGALATLGFAPFNLWPLTVLAYLALLWLVAPGSGRRPAGVFAVAMVWGTAHFCTGIYWVYLSTVLYGNAPPWLGVVLVVLLSAVLALFGAGTLAIATRWAPKRWVWALAVPPIWGLFELLRSTILQGFPWLVPGTVFTDSPFIVLAPLLGVHGLGVVLFAVLTPVVLWLRAPDRRGALIASGCVLAIAALSAALPKPSAWTTPTEQTLSVVMIQGNVAQAEKWDREQAPKIADLYRRKTIEAGNVDLVLWPEVAVPYIYPQIKDSYLAHIGRKAAAQGTAIVLGTLIPNEAGDNMINSVVGIGATEGTYYKRHLVPFGEVFPLPDFMRPLLDVVELRYADLDTGAEGQAKFMVKGVPVGVSICFEDVFADEIAREARGAGLLINVTNLSWFHDATALPQALQMTRLRAAETGRPMLKVAQTGITAHVDADGQLVAQAPKFEVASLRTTVQPRLGNTPYMRWDDQPFWWLGGLSLIVLLIIARWCDKVSVKTNP
ncbi:apolipoprotein N-acyltransferase [bacterium]|nr:apolipoprotein N-acyltransferase [bacterium]